MRLSAKGEYGVRAMIHLALHYGDGDPVPLSRIAMEENISRQYLEQIFLLLRRSGLIYSVRGVKGGYVLSSPPGEIFVGDIVRVLEGPITPVDCLAENGARAEVPSCGKGEDCMARKVWERLRDQINQLLGSISLQDMMECKQAVK
ncbi:MAG TPA: Rrf2 family transcriptional regulator [Firmicutes bacterium]|jgi:Rrf2 family cysteine metabolism transcriptional repressor|nr:Rrf2 family transcriptional regulator [Bacillota bacterium]